MRSDLRLGEHTITRRGYDFSSTFRPFRKMLTISCLLTCRSRQDTRAGQPCTCCMCSAVPRARVFLCWRDPQVSKHEMAGMLRNGQHASKWSALDAEAVALRARHDTPAALPRHLRDASATTPRRFRCMPDALLAPADEGRLRDPFEGRLTKHILPMYRQCLLHVVHPSERQPHRPEHTKIP